MATMTRFVPFRSAINDVAVLQNRLNSIFSDFARPESGQGSSESFAVGNFVPAVDVYEDEHKVMLKLEVPGVKQSDIDVRLENQTLTVRGERRFEAEEKEENFHRIERRFGTFVRSFSLPVMVDTNSISANYDAGILSIQLLKKEAAKPKQVKIEVSGGSTQTPEAKQVEGVTAK